jgi:AAA domain-containing protein/IclR-like helix-turn-helix domain-containing protein
MSTSDLSRSPASGVINGSPVARRFKVLTFQEVEQLPDPVWLIEDVLPAQSLAVLYGAPGVGKTFLALDMALSIASARKWAGRETTPGAVVYIVAEGVAGLSKRLKAWCVAREVSEVPRVYLVPDAPQLAQRADVEQLVKDLRAQIPEPISLVIIDTMARCFVGGDENSAKDVGELISGADRLRKQLDCAVLLVHHTTKKGDSERGSSALRGAPETMISIQSASGTVTVTCEKQKDAEPFNPIPLRLHPVAGSCVVEPADGRSVWGKALQCLRVLAAHRDGLTATEWQEASGVPETSFYRYRKELESDGLVAKEGSRYQLTEQGRAALTPTSNPLLAG